MSFSKVKPDYPSPQSSSSSSFPTNERKKSQGGSSSSSVLRPGELYSDSFFPPVVRPTPQYSYPNQQPHNNFETVDGLVKEAFEYKQQVRNKKFPHQQQQQHKQKQQPQSNGGKFTSQNHHQMSQTSSEESSSPESTVEVNNSFKGGYSTLHSSGEEDESFNHHQHQQQPNYKSKSSSLSNKNKDQVTSLPSIDSVYYDHLLRQGFQETTPPLDNTSRRRCLDDHVKDIINSRDTISTSPPPAISSSVDRNVIRQLEERVNALELEVKTSSNNTSPSSSGSSVVPQGNPSSSYRSSDKSPSPLKSPPRHSPPKMDHLKQSSSSASASAAPSQSNNKVPLTYSCRHCTFKNKNVDSLICAVCAKSQDFIDEEDDAAELLQNQHNNINNLPKLYSKPEDQETKESNVKQQQEHIECPQCTFHNLPVRRVCDICGFRFKYNGAKNESPVPPQSFSSAALT